jgi:diphosphomevalonate decarboxylase
MLAHHIAQPLAAAATAHPNIALIKYWGKRPGPGNLPAVGSLSITLDTLQTSTAVRFVPGTHGDRLTLNGVLTAGSPAERLTAFLDIVRRRAGFAHGAEVHSNNNFPTGAGLASSASGFAALAHAATAAAGLQLDAKELSILARRGSGSAARSVFAGFVEMARGDAADGQDAVAVQLHPAAHWPLRVIVAVTSTQEKAVGSTAGMEHTRHTAPYYGAWLADQEHDLAVARAAVAARDFAALAAIAEHSCMKMHALAMAAQPPLLYWNPVTVAAMQAVVQLRRSGVATFYTIDAGPQIKAVCLPDAAQAVHDTLACIPGVTAVHNVGLGAGVQGMADAPRAA